MPTMFNSMSLCKIQPLHSSLVENVAMSLDLQKMSHLQNDFQQSHDFQPCHATCRLSTRKFSHSMSLCKIQSLHASLVEIVAMPLDLQKMSHVLYLQCLILVNEWSICHVLNCSNVMTFLLTLQEKDQAMQMNKVDAMRDVIF